MKRLLTYLSAIIIMMMVPIGVQAWDTVTFQSHTEGVSSTNMTQESSNVHYLDLDLSSINTDVTFMFYVSNGHGDLGRNDDATENFDLSSASSFTSYGHKGSSKTWTLKHSTSKYAKYKITAEWKSKSGDTDYWDIKIEGTEEKSSGGDTPATGDNNFYLVGNFMSTDGNTASAINYDNKIFRMKYIGNNQYSFDVPATLTVYSQILSVNGSTTQAYGPSTNQTSGPSNDGTINGTLTSASAKTNNYWQMYDRGLSSDGMYTYTITVDGNGVPTKWSIKHDRLTRVAYFLPNPSEHSNATAQPCYSKRNNSSSAGSNKYFGNFYLEQGKHAYVVSNITLDADNNNNSLLKTVNKLYLQGNGGGTPETGVDNDTKVYPHQSTGFRFNNTVAITLEYNPSKGTESNLQTSDNRIGGEILKGGSNQLDITSMAVIGNGVGTADWDLSHARAMTYNKELKCWEITITTTAAESTDNLFRFVANGSWNINWYENGTAATDKARVPYTDTGDGHAATEADVNVVEKTNDAHATTARDIIFNRPAGEWTIRFYTDATSTQGGNYFDYNFYYTITGTENTDPDATLSPGTDGGNYDFDNYTTGTPKTLTVTLSNATKYAYAIGANSSVTLDESSTKTNGSFTLTYDGAKVTDAFGNEVTGNTVYVKIQGQDASDNKGTTHTYQYTFNVPVVSTLDFTPKGGLFINSAKITVTGGTPPYTYTVKDASDASGKVLSTGNFVLADNDTEDNYRISTPGYLTVTDALGNTATSTELFDFTYSTSENYKNYTNNATISKTVQTGGGEGALNVFMQVDETLEKLWLYAYNKTLDAEWKAEHGEPAGDAAKQAALDKEVRLTSAFPGDNIKDADQINIDGIKYVHFTIPEDNLREGDRVAIIVSQGTTEQQYWYTQTTDKGIEIERTSDPAFIYVVKNSPSAAPSTGSENSKGTNYLLKMSENGTRTIFVTVPEGWNDGTIYCDGWKDGGGEQDKLAWKSSAECLQLYDASTRTYIYQVPDIITNFYIATKNSAGTQTKRSVAVSYSGGRKMYTIQSSMSGSEYNMTETSDDVPDADLDELTTFLTTPPTTTVITNKYPNGEDYWRAAPGDLSIKLDPTWGGKTFVDETSVVDWTGTAVPKRINPEKMPLTQTIQGLNAGKTYTVQAIVRGLGQDGKTVTLTLEGATTVSKTLNLRNGSGGSEKVSDLGRQGNEVTKTGRIEYIEPLNLAGMNKHTGTDAAGWAKVEATVKASQAGWLTISLTGDEWFDLSQVTLLEDANTDHGFRTTASTSATDTDLANVDFRDRSWKKNNAFSFFDRGKNRNAVVFADKRTVIAMDKSLLAPECPNRDIDRRHPFNVVATNGASDTNGEASVLYLTDMGYGNDANNPVDYQIGENNSDWGEEYNSTNYRKSGYTFKPTLPFTASKVVMDRPIGKETTNRQTTIMLPFAISQNELQTYYGSALKVWSYASYSTDERKIVFTELEGDLVPNTPYILTGAVNPTTGGTAILDSRNNTSSTAKTIPEVTSTMYATAEKHSGFTGTYAFQTITRGDENETRYGFNPSTGKFQIASYSGAALKPFRAYFTLPLPYEAQTSAPAYTVVFDDTITGISDTIQVEVEPTDVYTLGGVRVATKGDLSRLPKGVYIVNGKKVIK